MDQPLTRTEELNELPEPIKNLAKRLGIELFRERFYKQATHWARFSHQGEGILAVEKAVPVDIVLSWMLRLTGLYERGNRNFRDIRVIENTFYIKNLDEDLSGFRLLHVSDLHADLDTSLTPVLLEKLQALEYDLAVITGDFCNQTRSDPSRALEETDKIVKTIKTPCYGILGNHDFIELVPELESSGIRLLLNECAIIPWKNACISLSGIDDPHFYQTHDLDKAARGCRSDSLKILLSHSPETWREAAKLGFDIMLSGHTHGGQICLPGGIPVIRNGRCPVNLIRGSWEQDQLQGYTSAGTGSCGVPIRFNCPPEVTIHTIRPQL